PSSAPPSYSCGGLRIAAREFGLCHRFSRFAFPPLQQQTQSSFDHRPTVRFASRHISDLPWLTLRDARTRVRIF
ncbi:hypothetical protein PFISCL1PPCAC_1074, partial [Pristionchus fissidentatus]